jgi:hypothetical protein
VGFIEVFDEHDTCLLYLDVEPPPAGAAEQSVRVMLSGGRELSAALAFSDASPTVHVVYENPALAFERHADAEGVEARVDAVEASEEERPRRTWTFWAWTLWPQAIRFVTVGIILGVLLANPRSTLAAVDYMRRGIADVVGRVVELIRPRPVLPSRPVVRPGAVFPAPRVLPGAPVARSVLAALPPSAANVSDIGFSELMLTTMSVLDEAGALTREQLRVERGADRRVHVLGGVESAARRRELRDALRELPAEYVRIELAAADDAAPVPAPRPTPVPSDAPPRTSGRGMMRSAEITRDRVPAAHEYVRRAIIALGSASEQAANAGAGAADVDVEARRFASALLSRSLSARVSAAALQQIVVSVPPADAAHLSPAAMATWRRLIRRHAAYFRQETASLRGDLERIFPLPAGAASGQPSSGSLLDAWQIARRIFDIASAHDLAVRRAFAVTADGSESLDVSTPSMRRSLVEAEHLAEILLTAPPFAPPFASTP